MKQARLLSVALILFYSFFAFNPIIVEARTPISSFPRRANYFLNWSLTAADAKALSQWDLVILDVENQYRNPELVRQLRVLNPRIVILAYLTPQEIRRDAAGSGSIFRARLAAEIPDNWYLKNSHGDRLSWWSGTWLLNVTTLAPTNNGKTFTDYLSNVVARDVLGSGLWDGVFYDNAWDNITYFSGTDVDTNNDGVTDRNPNAGWIEGMKSLYTKTRAAAPPGMIIIGNGTTRAYRNELDGMMLENFAAGAWTPTMQTYKFNDGQNRFNIINANTHNTGRNNFQEMRFGLTSALLQNGYYSYDYGDQNHGQTWQYDEYGVNLGVPQGAATAKNTSGDYTPDVWERNFEHGLTVVNSTDQNVTVDLHDDYERIHGTQDTKTNDGSIVSQVSLGANDGTILLKTVTGLNDVLFTNGNFARFIHVDGTRARNGLFLFEDGYHGGDQIAHIDLDDNGARDTVIVSGNHFSVVRDDGQPLINNEYPYTANFKGTLVLAFGDMNNDGKKEIYVAPSQGKKMPIKIYDPSGDAVAHDWFPFGEKYAGGYTLAFGLVGTEKEPRVVVGAGTGRDATISVYDPSFGLVREWRAFSRPFKGGVRVAIGDFNGDGKNEIAAVPGPGIKPQLKFFYGDGTSMAKSLNLTGVPKTGVNIRAADVDFDGKDDVVLLTNGVGL